MIDIARFRLVVIVGFTLIVGIGDAFSERPDKRFWQNVRMVQDAPVLGRRLLEKKGISDLVPVLIKSGTAGRGDRGLMISGEIDVLDFDGESAPIRTISYSTQLRDMPRHWREEARAYSPYIHNGGFALCEKNPEFDTGVLTEFPKTYIMPLPWIEQLGVLGPRLEDQAFFVEMTGRNARTFSGTEVLLYLASLSPDKKKHVDLTPLLESGDVHSKALVVMTLLGRDLNGEPAKLAEWIDRHPNPTSVSAAAMGTVAYAGVARGNEAKLQAIADAIERYVKKSPNKLDDLTKALEFLRRT